MNDFFELPVSVDDESTSDSALVISDVHGAVVCLVPSYGDEANDEADQRRAAELIAAALNAYAL